MRVLPSLTFFIFLSPTISGFCIRTACRLPRTDSPSLRVPEPPRTGLRLQFRSDPSPFPFLPIPCVSFRVPVIRHSPVAVLVVWSGSSLVVCFWRGTGELIKRGHSEFVLLGCGPSLRFCLESIFPRWPSPSSCSISSPSLGSIVGLECDFGEC